MNLDKLAKLDKSNDWHEKFIENLWNVDGGINGGGLAGQNFKNIIQGLFGILYPLINDKGTLLATLKAEGFLNLKNQGGRREGQTLNRLISVLNQYDKLYLIPKSLNNNYIEETEQFKTKNGLIDLKKLDKSNDWHERLALNIFKLNKIKQINVLGKLIGEYEANRKDISNEYKLYLILKGNGFFNIKSIYNDLMRSKWNLVRLIEVLDEFDLIYLIDFKEEEKMDYQEKIKQMKTRIEELENNIKKYKEEIEKKNEFIDYYKEGLKETQEELEKIKKK